MSSIELVWYLIIAGSCLFAIADWRSAIYVGILIDVLRDPVRKLTPGQPVTITLSGVVVWLIIVLMVVLTRRDQLRLMYRNYPKLRTAVSLLMLALIPAALISVVSYPRGWVMAAIGGASYIVPAFGVLTGFALLRREENAVRIMQCYVLVNCIMLVSVPFEYNKMAIPALGGIDFDWIRHRTGYIVQLMCGWYRSPDVMGLHAAHVMMFSLLLAIRPRGQGKALWIAPVLWAAFCVLLSGRRKMIGIPLVFVATFLILGMIYRVTKVRRMTGIILAAALVAGALMLVVWSPAETSEHTDYAATLFSEGLQRSSGIIIGSTMGTLMSVGVIGAGLGTATQGRYHAGIQLGGVLKGWQEDGVSRLFMEFGIPGVLLLVCCLVLLLGALFKAMRSIPRGRNEILMQLGLVAIVAGDAASFAISHQQFSGDPVNALFVTLMIGMILRMPGTLQLAHKPVVGVSTAEATPDLMQPAFATASIHSADDPVTPAGSQRP